MGDLPAASGGAALPPVAGRKKKEPLRPKKHVEDYEVPGTAEDAYARLGATQIAVENSLARRMMMLSLTTFFFIGGCKFARRLLVGALLGGGDDDWDEWPDHPRDYTDEHWEWEREELEFAFGKEWTDANFAEYKRLSIASEDGYVDDAFFPDELWEE